MQSQNPVEHIEIICVKKVSIISIHIQIDVLMYNYEGISTLMLSLGVEQIGGSLTYCS